MVCKSCGKELAEGAMFCGACGTKVEAEEIKTDTNEEVKAEVQAEVMPETKEETKVEVAEEAATENAATENAATENAATENAATENAATEEAPAVAPVFGGADVNLSKEQPIPAAAPVSVPTAPAQATKEEKPKMNAGTFFKKFWFIFAIIGVIAVIVIVIAANFKYIANAIMKNGSSDTYFKWVAKNYVEEQTEDAIALYNDYKAIYHMEDEKVTGDVSVEFGEDAEKYLKLAKAAGYDFTWVQTAGISYTVNSKEELLDFTVGGSFNGVEVLEIDYINDLKNEEEYISFPSVKSAYGVQESFDADEILEAIAECTTMADAMPNSDVMKKLIIRYMGTAIDQVGVGNVKVSDKTLRAGGITQELTSVTLTIDNDLCQKIALEIVKQMQEDKELRKVIEQYISDLEDSEYAEYMDLEDFDYDDFLDELSDAEDEIEDTVFLQHYDWSTGEYVEDEYEYTLYVNNKGEIVGCEIEYEARGYYSREVEYKCYKVQKGSNVAYKYDNGYFVMLATGKESGKKFTGEITFEYSGIDIATVEATKFDIDGLSKGKLSGKFVIIPDDSMFRYASMASSYEDMVLVVDCDINIKSGKLMLEIDDDDEMVAKLNLSYNISNGSKIKVPSGKNVIDMEDSDSGEELYESMDLNLLVQALDKAGAPDDVIEDIEDIEDYDDFLDFMDDLFY